MKSYPKYKDSGIEWIGEIPEHWEVKKLKYVADASPSNIDKKSKDDEEEIFLCNYVDVYKNEFITSEFDFMKATANEAQIDKFILRKGDVIATKDSETPDDIANPALVLENFDNVVCGYHLTHIKPFKINGDYLFRFFQSKFLQSYFEVSANGVTRYGLGVDKFNSALVLNPPSEEQTAIADYLDRKTAEIDDLIAQKERLLELYEEEKTAIINQAVTKGVNPDVKLKDSEIEWLGEIPAQWEVKKFKYLFELITEKNDVKLKKIGLENIESKTGKFIDTETDFEGEGIHFKPNDILFGKLRPYLAKVYLAEFEGKAVGDFYVFRCKNEINEKYTSNLILSKSFIEVANGSTFGSKMPRVSYDFIANLEITYPKIEEQQSIVQHIETETTRINTKAQKNQKTD